MIVGHRLYAAAGQRQCDVDLDDGTAVISQQLQQHDGHLAVCPPKTPHSVRVIALATPPSRRSAPTVTGSAPRPPGSGPTGIAAGVDIKILQDMLGAGAIAEPEPWEHAVCGS